MNNILHDQLNTLRLLSRLKEGQSLYISNGVTVYEFSYFYWAYRKLAGDNKNEVTRWLQEFYKSIDQSADQLICELRSIKDDTKRRKTLLIVRSFALVLKDSIRGIENLSKTYSQYPKTISILEGVIKDYLLFTYNQLIEVVPPELMVRELTVPITFNGLPITGKTDSDTEQ